MTLNNEILRSLLMMPHAEVWDEDDAIVGVQIDHNNFIVLQLFDTIRWYYDYETYCDMSRHAFLTSKYLGDLCSGDARLNSNDWICCCVNTSLINCYAELEQSYSKEEAADIVENGDTAKIALTVAKNYFLNEPY